MRTSSDKMYSVLALLGLLSHGVYGLAHVARVTDPVLSSAFPTTISSHLSRTTTPPSILELRKRQSSSDSPLSGTFLFAPDSICGYVSGYSGAPWQCNEGDQCAFATELGGYVACCSGAACDAAATACADRRAVSSSNGGCGSSCINDPLVRKCTRDTDLPYCHTYTFSGGFMDYGCGSNITSTPQVMKFSSDGAPSVVFTTQVIGFGFVTNADDGPGMSTSSTTGTSSSSVASNTPTTEVAVAAAPTPIGPIVGGAVGGAVGLILLALGGFLLWRRRSKKNKATQQEQQMLNSPQYQQQYQHPQQQPFIPHNSGNSYYQPTTPSAMYQNELPTEHNSQYASSTLQPNNTGRPPSEMPAQYHQATSMTSPGSTHTPQMTQHTGSSTQAQQQPTHEMP